MRWGNRMFPRKRARIGSHRAGWGPIRDLFAWNKDDSRRVGDRVAAARPGIEQFDRDEQITAPSTFTAYVTRDGEYVYIGAIDPRREQERKECQT